MTENQSKKIIYLLKQLVQVENKENVKEAKVHKLSTVKGWVWIVLAIGGIIVPTTAWFVHAKDLPSRVSTIEKTYIKERLNERVFILEKRYEERDTEVAEQLESINEEIRELNITDDRLERKIDLLLCHDIDGRSVQECITVVNYNR